MWTVTGPQADKDKEKEGAEDTNGCHAFLILTRPDSSMVRELSRCEWERVLTETDMLLFEVYTQLFV